MSREVFLFCTNYELASSFFIPQGWTIYGRVIIVITIYTVDVIKMIITLFHPLRIPQKCITHIQFIKLSSHVYQINISNIMSYFNLRNLNLDDNSCC